MRFDGYGPLAIFDLPGTPQRNTSKTPKLNCLRMVWVDIYCGTVQSHNNYLLLFPNLGVFGGFQLGSQAPPSGFICIYYSIYRENRILGRFDHVASVGCKKEWSKNVDISVWEHFCKIHKIAILGFRHVSLTIPFPDMESPPRPPSESSTQVASWLNPSRDEFIGLLQSSHDPSVNDSEGGRGGDSITEHGSTCW